MNVFNVPSLRRNAAQAFIWVAAVILLTACGTTHYRQSADKEAYGIVQQVEKQIFGHTNAFTIDTPYSGRNPTNIPATELIEDRFETNRRLLTIEGALDLAVTKSRRYQAARETLYLTALSLTGARYAFSPQFIASSTGTLTRTSTGERYVSMDNKISVSQMLASGGRVGMSLANDLLHYYSSGSPGRKVTSLISLNLTQPLLRGFGRNNPEAEALTQAERNVIYAVRNYSFFQDQFALEIAIDYFNLLAQKDSARNQYTNYLGRVQSTRRLEARAADRERLADVDQARQAELTAKNNYVNAVATYNTALDQFKIKLGLPVAEKVALDDATLDRLEENGLVPESLDADQAYRLAAEKQLPILNEIDRFEDSKRKIRVAADQLKADLKIFGNTSLGSDQPTDYTHFNANNVSAGVGMELDLPLDRLRERNDYRAVLISFEAEIRNLTLALDTLRVNVQHGLGTLNQRRLNYEIQKQALALANRRVTSTTMLLEAGRAEVRDLVDAQDALISAQNLVTTAVVEYQQTRLQLLLDIGVLDTSLPQFWLKDHLTPAFAGARTGNVITKDANQSVLPPEDYFKNYP